MITSNITTQEIDTPVSKLTPSFSRLCFSVVCIILGFLLGLNENGSWQTGIWGGLAGSILAAGILGNEHLIKQHPFPMVFTTALSAITGLLLAGIFSWLFMEIFPQFAPYSSAFFLTTLVFFPYLCITIGRQAINHVPWLMPTTEGSSELSLKPLKILDTSSIIDGRILDLCTTGFLEGPLAIPQFVLFELQGIADSSHNLKRTRGKRGLKVLDELRAIPSLHFQILNQDFPDIHEVDEKLIQLAKGLHAKVVTNDWNLAKVASLQDVTTLNVNELCYQLKPLVLPGEIIRIFIAKEGELPGQGVAHLDDGTMVVVDEGCLQVGKVAEVVVTRLIQSGTGRIIFSSLHNTELQSSRTGYHPPSNGNQPAKPQQAT